MPFAPPKLFTTPRVRAGIPCPKCVHGTVVFRQGQHGHFRGCTMFPDCNYSSPLLDLDELDLCLGFDKPQPEESLLNAQVETWMKERRPIALPEEAAGDFYDAFLYDAGDK